MVLFSFIWDEGRFADNPTGTSSMPARSDRLTNTRATGRPYFNPSTT